MQFPQGYDLIGYGGMIANGPRIQAYCAALKRAIRPGCTVLDIGAGTGIFSLLSCQFGAGHVDAIEPNEAVTVAKSIAQANGFSDRIDFHKALSTDLALPLPADVVVSDLRGVLPLFQGHIPTIVDARQRHLAASGKLIPQCDTIWAALVDDRALYRPYEYPWLSNDFDLNMQAAHPFVVNKWMRVKVKGDRLLVEPQRWATLDYRTIVNPNIDATLTWVADRAGVAQGILLWFDTDLLDGIGFSNAPGEPELIYGQAYFPIQKPIAISRGDQVVVRIAANLPSGEYVWRWGTDLFSSHADSAPIPTRRVRFQQSTFLGRLISLETLRRREASYVPELPSRGQAERFMLLLMDGDTSLSDIARQTAAKFPDLFPRWQDALARAGELAEKFSQ